MATCDTCGCDVEAGGPPAPDRVYMCPPCARSVALELMNMAKDKKRAAREARDLGLTRAMFDNYNGAYTCIVAAHEIWRQLP